MPSTFGKKFEDGGELRAAIDNYFRGNAALRQTVIDTYGDMSKWKVQDVKDFASAFDYWRTYYTDLFNWNGLDQSGKDLSEWDTSSATDFTSMFGSLPSFSGDLSMWNTSSVTTMEETFKGVKSSQVVVAKWDVSQVTSMRAMFSESNFNGDLSGWQVGKVRNMASMFSFSKFNTDISQWDVSQVSTASSMFSANREFNQPIGNWKLEKVDTSI